MPQLPATADSRTDRRSAWAAPLLAFGLAVLVTALLLASVTRSVSDRDRIAFEGEMERTTDAVRERLDTTLTLLYGAAGLFTASDEVRREEFTAYIRQLRLRERYPGILGVGYSVRLAPTEVAVLEHRQRVTGMPEFRVWPDTPRDEFHSIVFLEPLDARNAAAIGYDMATEPVRREAMERARDEGRPVASRRVTLVQEIDQQKQAGFLVYLPMYRGGITPPRYMGK